jgi:hypothetical protein
MHGLFVLAWYEIKKKTFNTSTRLLFFKKAPIPRPDWYEKKLIPDH